MSRVAKPGSRSAADENAVPWGPETEAMRLIIADVAAKASRLAYNKTEAAELLGVSVEFFDEHVAPEIRCVHRGRRRLYSIANLMLWLWRSGEGPEHKEFTGKIYRTDWRMSAVALAAIVPAWMPGFLA